MTAGKDQTGRVTEPPRDESWARPGEGGAQAPPPVPAPPAAATPEAPPAAATEPAYQAYPGQAWPPPYPGPPQAARPTSGLAIAALVCSLAGVFTGITAPIGAVLGHMALREIRRTGQEGASLATAAIWVGWIITGVAVVACCGVLAVLRNAGPMR